MSTEAMKLALEALEETRNALAWFYDSYPQDVTKKGNKLLPHVETVLTTLREELAEQPAQQEPVAWRLSNEAFDYQITSYDEEQANTYIKNGWHLIDVLYTSPPARKPLTDEEIEKVWRSVQANDFHDCVKPFARAIEAAHGITATREHVTDDSQCWCNPEITYTDPDTGVSVIVHKEPQ